MLMPICGPSSIRNVQAIYRFSDLYGWSTSHFTFPDEEFSVAIHDAGMFTVKEINRLNIDRGPGLLNLALTNMVSARLCGCDQNSG